MSSTPTPANYEYQRSKDDPERYYNSGRVRMYGGFEEAYEGNGDYDFHSLSEVDDDLLSKR